MLVRKVRGPNNATVITGDNLEVLRTKASDSVDLVYLDPPFNTHRPRRGSGDCADLAFDDEFGSAQDYIRWLEPRLEECVRVLKAGGALFAHCDWRVSHYIKVSLDGLLSEANFVNEIIWKRHSGHNDVFQGARHFGRNADTILFYGKGPRAVWNSAFRPYTDEYVATIYKHIEPSSGRLYALTDITAPGGERNGNPVFEFRGVTRAWRFSKAKLSALDRAGRIVTTPGATVPRRKRYLDEMPGFAVQSIWDDIPMPPPSERVGYPTQKPLALLERIIESSTLPGQTVLDPFCGSGTTLVAAGRLGRSSIGIDSSPEATTIAFNRLMPPQSERKARPSFPSKLLHQLV